MRAMLAEEVFPGVSPEIRRARLRHHLSELAKVVPIGKLLRRDGIRVGLDASCAEIDLVELFELGRRLRDISEPMSSPLIELVRRKLPLVRREFIPEWVEFEQRCNGGGGVAGDVVAQVRVRVEELRATMLTALADTCVARGRPAHALPLLREAMGFSRDPEGIAERLVAACEAANRHRSAARIREEYGVGTC
jgi:hypothetical protein